MRSPLLMLPGVRCIMAYDGYRKGSRGGESGLYLDREYPRSR